MQEFEHEEPKKLNKGFRVMDREKQREICSKGGKAAHALGVAHEWNSEEAAEAGKIGGRVSRKREYIKRILKKVQESA